MTADLLQSDIDLARRLIAQGESDREIIVALGYRRIDPQKAQRLVNDLRAGADVQPEPIRQTRPSQPVSPRDEPVRKPVEHSSRPIENDSGFPWFRVALLAVVGLTIAAVFLLNRERHNEVAPNPRELMTPPSSNLRRPVLRVEVEPHAVRISGTVISRENAVKVLSDLAGAATRTNQLEHLTMYAFDQDGIVLYSGNQAGKDSLMIYFEPVGGTNGAQHAFTGTLTVRGKPIKSNTDPKTLQSSPEWGLKETAQSFFSAQTNGLGLSFACLNNPTQVSLVQIDLE